MERIYLNNDWGFTESFQEEMCRPEFDVEKLQVVRLPHTCKETPLHYFDEHIYQMVSGYRRKIFANEEWRGKKVLLTLDGVAHESEVFLNGEKIGEHHCGYTAFSMDLSEKLCYGGENILVVKVDSREDRNIPPFGFVIDYMTYGGIYRDVYLEIRNQDYLEDVFLRSEIDLNAGNRTELISQITVEGVTEGVSIRQYLRKKGEENYHLLGEAQKAEEWKVGGRRNRTELRFSIEQALQGAPELWDVDNPALYEIKTELWREKKLLDEQLTVFGFRTAEFKTDGFYLNGRKLKIRGLNRHQCYPYVGYAMPESMQKRDADILKYELGVNAVRTSHYPQSHYFLERCDELGLLVFTEIPGWQHIGDEEWKKQAIQNVRDMVVQYRNHASIILWGVRINESVDDDEFYKRTNAAAHELDPSRQTGGVRALKKSNLLEDVYTYNDFVHEGWNKGCCKKTEVTLDKNKPYLISEYNGHMFPTKAFDCEDHRVEHALRHARVLDGVAKESDIAGSFGWCMFDYNTHKDFGSGDRICYHGVMDMFRNPKLAAAVYASQQEEAPVLSISSSMDIGEHPACNRGDTYIFTNADSVRMYKNDRFIREYKCEDSAYKGLAHGPILVDDYIGDILEKEEGFPKKQAEEIKKVLNAVARFGMANMPKSVYPSVLKLLTIYRMNMSQAVDLYSRCVGDWGGASTVYKFEAIKDGAIVKTQVKEPMKAVRLVAEADHRKLEETNSYDVAAVRIRAVDENGNTLHFYHDPVALRVEGEAELIGPDLISLQGGMGGTYIKTIGRHGKAILHVSTSQADETVVEFEIEV